MGSRLRTLLVISTLALPLQSFSQQPDQADVAMSPLEVLGEADPEFARSFSQQLMRAIEDNSRFRVVSDGAAPYLIKGQIFAGGPRHFVGLQLIEATTGATLWFENYDYRGITAEMMAADLLQALNTASQSGARE